MLLILLPAILAAGEELDIKINSSKKTVEAGEVFQLSLEVSGNTKFEVELPELASEIQMQQVGHFKTSVYINGNRKSSIVYNFLVRINSEGTFNIGPFHVISDEKTYNSDTLIIESLSAGVPQESEPEKKNFLLEASFKKKEAYVNEYIDCYVHFYRRSNFREIDYTGLSFPSSAWVENLENMQKYMGRVSRNGVEYEEYEMENKRIFISQPGLYEIPSGVFQLEGTAHNGFFSQRVQFDLETEPVSLRIKPLPPVESSGNFDGAVGNFKITSTLSKKKIKLNETAMLLIRLEGEGNFHNISVIDIDYDAGLEEFSAKSDIKDTNKRFKVKTWEHLLVPDREGSFSITLSDFTYFDPHKDEYITIPGNEFEVHVGAAEKNGKEENIIITPDSEAKRIKQENTENIEMMSYIKTKIGSKNAAFQYDIWKIIFIICYVFLILFLTVILLIKWLLLNIKNNNNFIDHKNAYRIFSKELGEIKKSLSVRKPEIVSDEVASIIEKYFSSKFNIDSIRFTTSSIRESLKQYLPEEDIGRLKDMIIQLDMVRFGGLDINTEETRVILEKLNDVIKHIDRQGG